MAYLSLPDADLYYQVHGDGPALVLVHGSGGNHLSFWRQLPVLSQRYRCIVWDQPGYGLSRTITPERDASCLLDDLTALLDHLGVRRAHLVGQSIGGHLCLRLALRTPDRVLSLVLADSLAGIAAPQIAAAKAQAGPLPEGLLERALAPAFRARNTELVFLYGAIERLNHAQAAPRLPAFSDVPAADVAKLTMPVLFLAGELDPVAPPAAVSAAAAIIAGSRLRIVPDAGHSVYVERPDAFNDAIADFISAYCG